MFQWDQKCKLGSIDTSVLGDISTQLLCERHNDSHSHSLAFGEIELGGESDSAVTHRNRNSVHVPSGKAYPNVSIGVIRKGMLGSVCDKLVCNQSYRNGSIGIQANARSDVDMELTP